MVLGNYYVAYKAGRGYYALTHFLPFSIYVMGVICTYWWYNRGVFLEHPWLFIFYIGFSTSKPAVILFQF